MAPDFLAIVAPRFSTAPAVFLASGSWHPTLQLVEEVQNQRDLVRLPVDSVLRLDRKDHKAFAVRMQIEIRDDEHLSELYALEAHHRLLNQRSISRTVWSDSFIR